MSLEELRARQRSGEKGLLDKYSERVGRVEKWRPWFGGLAVLGAMIAAIARAIEGSWGLGFTIVGVLFAAGGGALVVLMDYRKLEITQDAKDAHAIADEAISLAGMSEGSLAASKIEASQNLEALNERWTSLDRQRRARNLAVRRMVENVEAALLGRRDVSASAQKMLEDANEHIRQAVRCKNEDYFTISIFRREIRNPAEGERMHRIGCYATVTKERNYDNLSWAKGKGYTGSLWNEATVNATAKLVLPDTTLPGLRDEYPVDNYDPEREDRYVSVAAFPILIERTENVWGIVTATADRKDVFDMQDPQARQGVEMVADIAYVAALLAGIGSQARP